MAVPYNRFMAYPGMSRPFPKKKAGSQDIAILTKQQTQAGHLCQSRKQGVGAGGRLGRDRPGGEPG